MDPSSVGVSCDPFGFPRTRGDGPWSTGCICAVLPVSPHSWGWTDGFAIAGAWIRGFPALVGMDLSPSYFTVPELRFPRTRGDGPCFDILKWLTILVSPHSWGWTDDDDADVRKSPGFPALVGMDRLVSMMLWLSSRFPRTRGDGPRDGQRCQHGVKVSPHSWGWTSGRRGGGDKLFGFPALVGMDHPCPRGNVVGRGFPRTRGDGPDSAVPSSPVTPVSPHSWGWTRVRSMRGLSWLGFPALVGMDPIFRVRCSTL